MNEPKYILALDQGTTSSRAIIFDADRNIVAVAQKEFEQIFPQPGWVEHRPSDIWESQLEVARKVLEDNGISPAEIAAIGITNQRETTIVWNAETGEALGNAIVWQDRRTAGICDELKQKGLEPYVREQTGLVLDAYFSGTKIKWILDNHPGSRDLAKAGKLKFGTVDSWLIWKLSKGAAHVSDYSNASRTLIYNIRNLEWDQKLLRELDIPHEMLPEVKPSSGKFGLTAEGIFGNAAIPILGVAGDQQAALFGQACFEPGTAKNTYGTGCFMLMNTGNKLIQSQNGLLTTIAWGLDGKVDYALEGSVFIAGAAIQWLRDELNIVENSADSEALALSVPDTGGVYVVPAFAGMGAPYWDMYARGAILGLTRGSGKAHLVRATLESLAFQTKDVLEAMEEDAGIQLTALRVDGGASANNFLMQFQSDVLDVPVERPVVTESTAFGAACLAALDAGLWQMEHLANERQLDKTFSPEMGDDKREALYKGWKKAVQRSLAWEDPSA